MPTDPRRWRWLWSGQRWRLPEWPRELRNWPRPTSCRTEDERGDRRFVLRTHLHRYTHMTSTYVYASYAPYFTICIGRVLLTSQGLLHKKPWGLLDSAYCTGKETGPWWGELTVHSMPGWGCGSSAGKMFRKKTGCTPSGPVHLKGGKTKYVAWGWSSVAWHLPQMCKTLSLTPNTGKKLQIPINICIESSNKIITWYWDCFYFLLLFFGICDQTQDLALVRQSLCHWVVSRTQWGHYCCAGTVLIFIRLFFILLYYLILLLILRVFVEFWVF